MNALHGSVALTAWLRYYFYEGTAHRSPIYGNMEPLDCGADLTSSVVPETGANEFLEEGVDMFRTSLDTSQWGVSMSAPANVRNCSGEPCLARLQQ